MLKTLEISNYALISHLKIHFTGGFSVLTGETGAGKSIIIGALSLILGQRADTKAIKEGEQKCIIEADFDIQNYQLEAFFLENELDYDAESCLIRRELMANGKSRAFVNDSPVSLAILRSLSTRLIDIHSQHENLLISNEAYQLDIVDSFAQNRAVFEKYSLAYEHWSNLLTKLTSLKKTAEKQRDDFDYISFQYQQLSEASLQEGEQEELEQEQDTLSHAEEIKTELFKSVHLLSDEQMSLSLLKETVNSLSRIKNYIPSGEEWGERLHSLAVDLKDIADEMASYEERVEFNPERLLQIEDRLALIYSLLKKYRVAKIDDLIRLRDEFELQLQNIESFDQQIEDLEKSVEQALEVLKTQADNLTMSRTKVSNAIEEYMEAQLTLLGMPNAKFQVEITGLENFSEQGNDRVQLLFSANKNKTVQPIIQTASGGEISRLMLSLKSLVANKQALPTIIFDEVDTGVSGEIAHRMGEIMLAMAQNMQVLSITHLPQIASKGLAHYKVFKDETGEQAQTFIQKLKPDERIDELAKMLSGEKITDAAVLQAKELLEAERLS